MRMDSVLSTDACPGETTVFNHSPLSSEMLLQWPETPIGTVAEVLCPCETVGVPQIATRSCGGDFITGGIWGEPEDHPCNFSILASQLCEEPDV